MTQPAQALALVMLTVAAVDAQDLTGPGCRVLCAPELKLEPTITFEPLVRRERTRSGEELTREPMKTEFELILSLGLATRKSWLDFTVEAIVMPFDRDATPELEFEANLVWLPPRNTRGWVSSHFDVVDKFSPAERPSDRRAYTHKLNFELDTSVSPFKRLPEGRWLRGLELEGSLDFVATGLVKAGDVIEGRRYLDDAGPWSFSLVLVLPVAPF
jgi:hypothetical protein